MYDRSQRFWISDFNFHIITLTVRNCYFVAVCQNLTLQIPKDYKESGQA